MVTCPRPSRSWSRCPCSPPARPRPRGQARPPSTRPRHPPARPSGPCTSSASQRSKPPASSGRRPGWSRPPPGTPSRAGPGRPPPGTPTATSFGGVPTIGALFYTTGSTAHFCTASVVDSNRENLIMTAAHCVYASGYSVNIEFVPGYHKGQRPYGTWLIQAVVVAKGWRQRHDPDLDSPSSPSFRPAAPDGRSSASPAVCGWASTAATTTGSGWSAITTRTPTRCGAPTTASSSGPADGVLLPWFPGRDQRWTVGHRLDQPGRRHAVRRHRRLAEGGDYDWASYSPAFGAATLALYRQAEATAALRRARYATPAARR